MQLHISPPAEGDAGAAAQGSGRGRRLRQIGIGVVVLLVALTLVSLPGNRRTLIDPAGRDPVVGVTEVEVRDDLWEYFAFSPSVIEVEAGTAVTWTSTSGTAHNVVFHDGPASPLFEAGESWSATFDTPGDYRYVCTLHEGMDGRVVVTPAEGPR